MQYRDIRDLVQANPSSVFVESTKSHPLDLTHRMYERSLNQILQVLRRIRCLTYGMFLITFTTLILYLLHDVMSLTITRTRQTVYPLSYQEPGFGATIQMAYEETCEAQKNIIFTKTHKTGSSTITNILLRYGELHNLTQLLYQYPSSTEYKRLDDSKLMTGRYKANIFAQHAIHNREFLQHHIHNASKTFTILRSPVSQFLSAFSFFDKRRVYPADTFEESIKLFFKSHGHQRYMRETHFCKNCGNLVNANSFDMGFKMDQYVKSSDKDGFMSAFLEHASRSWDLVLITEYFDLSLVLLKRRFCLQFEDILYLRSLERVKKETVEEPYTLAAIVDMQRVDIAIYNYFNQSFWREVEKEAGIFEELAMFQKLNKVVQSFCVAGSKVGYQGTLANVLSEEGRKNFHCLAMNTRCLPFSLLLEGRDDSAVTPAQLQTLIEDQGADKDSLNYDQIQHLSRDTNIIQMASRNKLKL